MPEATKDRSITKGYSLPESLHGRIAYEARYRDMSASQLVRRAVTYYLRNVPVETDQSPERAAS